MPYVDPSDRQPDGLPWSENTPARVQAYNALVRQVARADPGEVSVIDLNRMLEPDGRLHGVARRGRRALRRRHPHQPRRRRAAAAPDPARGRSDRHGGRGGKGPRVTDPEAAETPAAEVVVESVPAAMALAPNAVGPNLGAELLLDAEARPGVESMRAGLLQAGPLAAAGVLANGASVVLTVALARLLTPHSYGVLNQLTGPLPDPLHAGLGRGGGRGAAGDALARGRQRPPGAALGRAGAPAVHHARPPVGGRSSSPAGTAWPRCSTSRAASASRRS